MVSSTSSIGPVFAGDIGLKRRSTNDCSQFLIGVKRAARTSVVMTTAPSRLIAGDRREQALEESDAGCVAAGQDGRQRDVHERPIEDQVDVVQAMAQDRDRGCDRQEAARERASAIRM